MEQLKVISIGSDPEFFLQHKDTGEVVPAFTVFGGTKEAAWAFEHGSVLSDNIMLELNPYPSRINRPAIGTMFERLQLLREEINHLVEAAGLQIMQNVAQVTINEALLADDRVSEFGCEPDLGFWNNSMPKAPYIEGTLLQRHAGGHIHLGLSRGWMEYSNREQSALMGWLDTFIGTLSVLNELPGDRRAYYGQAGSYRITKWGIEYRTPSNFWCFNENLANTINNELYNKDNFVKFLDTFKPSDMPEVADAINYGDRGACMEIYERISN